ncbi:hypothetical protein M0802_012413 [Mischocyttarus mexicanus]|nr:hypothetical protein M0802_012413 [Mischocyttarus mexicanus]
MDPDRMMKASRDNRSKGIRPSGRPPKRWRGSRIEYLREFLHLPPEIVPSTLTRQVRSETSRPRPAAEPRSEVSRPTEDRAGYRRGLGGLPDPGDKKSDVGAGTGNLEFRGGFG